LSRISISGGLISTTKRTWTWIVLHFKLDEEICLGYSVCLCNFGRYLCMQIRNHSEQWAWRTSPHLYQLRLVGHLECTLPHVSPLSSLCIIIVFYNIKRNKLFLFEKSWDVYKTKQLFFEISNETNCFCLKKSWDVYKTKQLLFFL